jgi:hypothetical protein
MNCEIKKYAVVAWLAVITCTAVVSANASPWQFDIKATLGTNDNVSQAEKDRDIVDDSFAGLNFSGTYTWDLSQYYAVAVRGFLETEQWQDVSGLSPLSYGGQFILRGQIGVGPTVPSYQFDVGIQADEYDFTQRDSTVTTSQLSLTKPITEHVSIAGGIEYRSRDSDGTVFDLDQLSGLLTGTFAFAHGWSLGGTYSYIDGDFWSDAQVEFCDGTPASDIFDLVSAADALEPDDAFNDAFCGRWFAYRLPGTANSFEIDVDKEFRDGIVLAFSLLEVQVEAEGDNNYDSTIVRASLAKRF